MTKVSQYKGWNNGAVKIHVEPPPIPLIKSNHDNKSEGGNVKIKLRRYTTSKSFI